MNFSVLFFKHILNTKFQKDAPEKKVFCLFVSESSQRKGGNVQGMMRRIFSDFLYSYNVPDLCKELRQLPVGHQLEVEALPRVVVAEGTKVGENRE